MGTTWQEFSKEISGAVADAGRSIVAVDGRAGHTSSGIIWRAGFILTAAHSIRHETNITVSAAAGTSVQARLVGKDRGTDIALLKLDQQIEAPPAHFGSTTSLSIGELVIAVARTRRGNIVASSGIISGLMGEWQVARTRIDQFIRPDLNLYPGFSGGALIGAGHGVLGLNTTGLLRGKPITIPSSTLARIAEEIETKGHVAQPYIGIVMQPVQIPESLQKKAGVSAAAGLLVMHVEAGSPADVAGVILGDVLIDMDGRAFDDLEDVHMTLREKGGGKDVHAGVIRAGQRAEITIRIGGAALALSVMVDVWIMAPSGVRRDWLTRCVAADSSLRVAGTATTFPFLRSLMAETTGDIVLVDVRPESQPSIVRDWLLQLSELAALLVLAPERDPEIYNRLVQTGAGGILQTDASDEQIVQAIKSIAAGLMVFDTAVMPQRPEEDPSAEALTPRESEVLRLLADGLGNKEIASRLNISEHTIKFHIRSILGKLGASSRTEAVSRGLRSGLIEL